MCPCVCARAKRMNNNTNTRVEYCCVYVGHTRAYGRASTRMAARILGAASASTSADWRAPAPPPPGAGLWQPAAQWGRRAAVASSVSAVPTSGSAYQAVQTSEDPPQPQPSDHLALRMPSTHIGSVLNSTWDDGDEDAEDYVGGGVASAAAERAEYLRAVMTVVPCCCLLTGAVTLSVLALLHVL